MTHLEAFALEGLRTLMVGSKEMTENDFEEWEEVKNATIFQEVAYFLMTQEIYE